MKCNKPAVIFVGIKLPRYTKMCPHKKESELLTLLKYMSGKNLVIHDFPNYFRGKKVVICETSKILAANMLEKLDVIFLSESEITDADALIIWGMGLNTDALHSAMQLDKPIILLEDGFIRSLFPYLSGELGLSFIFDSLGIHFASCYANSTIVNDLNSSFDLSEEEFRVSHNYIESLLSKEITKYNAGERCLYNKGQEVRKRVLVIDQAKNDLSVLLSNVESHVFVDMLHDAIDDNPESEIFVKIHPEQISGSRSGYFETDFLESLTSRKKNVHVLTESINSIALLKTMDTIYCVSTQMGLEALLCGKEVVVYGCPFYAGWGLTRDKQKIIRARTRRLEDIFHMAYVKYSVYFSQEKECFISLDEAMEIIQNKRDAFKLVFDIFQCQNKKLIDLQNKQLDTIIKLDKLNKVQDEKKVALDRLNQVQDEKKVALDRAILAEGTVSYIEKTLSWRLTKPLREGARQLVHIIRDTRTRLAWYKFLLVRSKTILKHQGMSGLISRAVPYMRSVIARKWRILTLKTRAPVIKNVSAESFGDKVIVSIIIPVYDRVDILRIAVDSALSQTVPNTEVIIVSDGSPPKTMEVINEYSSNPKVRIFNFPTSSGNAVRGRNKGIKEARGRYVAFLDSDDIAMPDRLERCLPLLETNQADVVYGAWAAILDGSRDIEGIEDGQVFYGIDADLDMLVERCIPCQSTVIVRKSLLKVTGLLKPSMQYREDHELWARLAFFGARFKSVPQVLTKLRLHCGNNELNFQHNDDIWFAKSKEEYRKKGPTPKKIMFILPGVGISGGIAVVFKHVQLLMKAGHDAFVVNVGEAGDGGWFTNNTVPIIHISDKRSYVFEGIDLLIATGWSTADWLDRFSADRKLYFVQSDERRFYDATSLKQQVEATYRRKCEYFTEAFWIQRMLKDEFGHEASYVPNGIDISQFFPDEPIQPKPVKKLRVLIEGPITIPFKGMADCYAAIENIDCEVWIVSSNGTPPAHWCYDRFFEGVSFGKMREVYSSCDIFLKMSRVEGFFGPPMEAMACGCAVVVGKVSGYDEYILHEFNALVIDEGDVMGATMAVERLIADDRLRESLIQGGRNTVREWGWDRSAKAMLELVNKNSSPELIEIDNSQNQSNS